ncbi:MAG: sigma-70 family RNA polymerase sigma factor [Vampirovibrionales bacterium]|nr:sigma-70 family RNA polymerase sigma factor [Vampirovibrionales bacterium]
MRSENQASRQTQDSTSVQATLEASRTTGAGQLGLKQLDVNELVLQAQSDKRSEAMPALEELVRRQQKIVYVTLYQLAPERQDIADLTQEVLLRMCRSIRTLKNPKTFKFWLNRIVTNLFYDELRKAGRQPRALSLDEPQFESDGDSAPSRDIPDERESPDKLSLNSELDQKIQAAIADLPEQFRTMIVLREVQNLSYEEIATLTHTNIGTVKSRLARARMRLQETLAPYLDV